MRDSVASRCPARGCAPAGAPLRLVPAPPCEPTPAISNTSATWRPMRSDGLSARPRILVDHRDRAGAELAQLLAAQLVRVLPAMIDRAGDPAVARQVVDERHRHRRLAAPRLAHQAERLALADAEVEIAHRRLADCRARGSRSAGRSTVSVSVRGNGFGRAHWLSSTFSSESEIRFTAITSDAMASAANSTSHQYPAETRPIVGADVGAPVGRRRLDTEAEERERRGGEDRVAQAHGELDQDRRGDVGQKLREHDVEAALVAQPGGGDVVELALLDHRGAHRATDQRREDEADAEGHR